MNFLIRMLVAMMMASELSASTSAPKAGGDHGGSFPEIIPAWVRTFADAGSIEVLEGLPHPFEGKGFVENEKRTKATREIDDNWFYAVPQFAQAEDKQALQRLFAAGLFKLWRGVKFCGGFHGDYAVRYESEDHTYEVLFCFGCHEARILRTSKSKRTTYRLTTDLAKEQFVELREVFKKYRKERPSPPPPKDEATPPSPPRVPVRLSRGS